MRPKVTLMKRDWELLSFLHAQKVASTLQLQRDIIGSSVAATRRRLLILKNLGLIEVVTRLEGSQATNIFSLSPKGFACLKRTNAEGFSQERYRSNSVDHDLKLVDIRANLEGRNNVAKFYSENEMQSLALFSGDPKLDSFRIMQVDAAVELRNQLGKSLLCALEFEANLKSKIRYRDRVQRYYLSDSIPAVLYVSLNPKIEEVVKYFEKMEAPKEFKKIYFASFDSFRAMDGPVMFENQDGIKFMIA